MRYEDMKLRVDEDGKAVSWTDSDTHKTYPYNYDCLANPDAFPREGNLKDINYVHVTAANPSGGGVKVQVFMGGARLTNPNPPAGESANVWQAPNEGQASWPVHHDLGCARVTVAAEHPLLAQIERGLVPRS